MVVGMSAREYDNALHMMEVIGGSFVKALANLYYCADSNNKRRLLAAFPEYFEKYEAQYKAHVAQSKGDAA
jgi:hypothetical protein